MMTLIKRLNQVIASLLRHKYIVIGSLIFLSLLWLLKPTFNTDYSQVILDETNTPLRVFLNRHEQQHFPPEFLEDIPERLKIAILTYEDRYFYWHPGINPIALVQATISNIKHKKIIRGASTITMQLARLRRPRPRTLWIKLHEMGVALLFELHYSKDELLRLYLTHAPYGSNIVGVQTAAYTYFKKPLDALSWAETAMLAVLPNAPGLVSPTYNPDILKRKRNGLLKTLYQKEHIDKATYELAIQEPIQTTINSLPFHAPHFTQFIRKKHPKKPLIKTTLSLPLQQGAQQIVADTMQSLAISGIKHAAVLVIHTSSREVRSWVGSPDYFDIKNEGNVDGVLAPRSSGSILKPFLYALSMDEGLILPDTLMRDVPTYFGTFSPANYAHRFAGIISARKALSQSLNIPAVRLLNMYGYQTFYTFLKQAGIKTLGRPADQYGLTLILGGSEVTLYDLAMLYTGLANDGLFSPNKYLPQQTFSATPLISPAGVSLTRDILTEVKRPGIDFYWELLDNKYPIAWKTGTSYGLRDAWAVGINPEWVVAVWVGNFSGQSHPKLEGASIAGPLMLRLFDFLPKVQQHQWFVTEYDQFKEVTLCATTGFLAKPYCPTKKNTIAPKVSQHIDQCPYHKQIIVDQQDKYRVCSYCWDTNRQFKTIQIYPPDITTILAKQGKPIPKRYSHNPNCPQHHPNTSLRIIYPAKNANIWLPKDYQGTLQMLTLTAASTFEGTVYWYLNNRFVGDTQHNHTLRVTPSYGPQHLVIVDEQGHRDETQFNVVLR